MRCFVLLGLAELAIGPGANAATQPPPQSLQQCLVREAEREGLSGSILVTQGNRTLASVHRGHLAGEGSPAIMDNTRFNLGSVSKMFTAIAIGQLIDAGQLKLDERVGDVVHGLTPEASRVTIRQLLTHTSGLGDFFRPENMAAMMKARTASDILPLISSEKPAFQPGSRFAYSNSGFALLGIVIERVSGMTYGEYLKRNLFGPAGMTSTGLDPRPLGTLAAAMTSGGMPTGGGGQKLRLIGPDGKPVAPGPATGVALRTAPGATEGFGSPAGGLFSTAQDMRRFAMALLSGKLLRQPTLREFTSPQVQAGPDTASLPARHYGFGFGLSEEGGLRWFGHNGGTLGANAEFWIEPEHQWAVSVLSNRDPPTATNVMRWAKSVLEGADTASIAGVPCIARMPVR